jgi:hypothetical protein
MLGDGKSSSPLVSTPTTPSRRSSSTGLVSFWFATIAGWVILAVLSRLATCS